jgi:hypothetical protein
MKLLSILLALVLGSTAFAAPAAAQRGGRGAGAVTTPMDIPKRDRGANAGADLVGYHTGLVKAVNKDEIVLSKTKAGVDQTFKFNKKTKFIRDGKGSSFQTVKLGDTVWVDADEDKKTGDLIARKVITGVIVTKTE